MGGKGELKNPGVESDVDWGAVSPSRGSLP